MLIRFGRVPLRLRLPAPRGRLGQRRAPKRTLALLLAFALSLAVACVVLERRSGPHIHALAGVLAKQQASQAVTRAVEQVLTDERVSYERLVRYDFSQGGIRAIHTDAAEVNLIRGKINSAVEQAVTLRRGKLRLPMGAVMGSSLFAGRGPNVTVPLRMTGAALSDIRSELSSSGVNQTMHRILMDLSVTISVILPGGVETSELALTVCLAETVIVGKVPGGLVVGQG